MFDRAAVQHTAGGAVPAAGVKTMFAHRQQSPVRERLWPGCKTDNPGRRTRCAHIRKADGTNRLHLGPHTELMLYDAATQIYIEDDRTRFDRAEPT